MRWWVLALAAYGITFAESVIHMRSLRAFNAGRRLQTASWEALFDIVLIVDTWLVVHELWLIVPIAVASFHGSWYAFPGRKPPDQTP